MNANDGKVYSIDAMRIIAAFCVVAIHFSFKGIIGELFWINSYYAVPFFFIVSGYFLITKGMEDVETVVIRRIKQTTKLFVYTAIVYFLVNVLYFVIYKGANFLEWLISMCPANKMFSFLVLNVWPFMIGGAIWFLQAMIYSYVIIFLLVKTKLIKYELYIAIVLLIINALFGEFSTLLNLPTLMASWFARALPYMLLGHYLRSHIHKMQIIKTTKLYLYIMVSILLCVSEYYILAYYEVLGYTGHYIGNTILALVLVIYMVQHPKVMENTILYKMGAKYSLGIYLIHQPLGSMLAPHLGVLSVFKPIIIFGFSFFVAHVYIKIKEKIKK